MRLVHASWKVGQGLLATIMKNLVQRFRLIALSENSDMEVTKMKALEDEIGYVQLQLENTPSCKEMLAWKGWRGCTGGRGEKWRDEQQNHIKHGQDNPQAILSVSVIVATALNFAQVVQWKIHSFVSSIRECCLCLRGVLDDVAHELHDNAGKWEILPCGGQLLAR